MNAIEINNYCMIHEEYETCTLFINEHHNLKRVPTKVDDDSKSIFKTNNDYWIRFNDGTVLEFKYINKNLNHPNLVGYDDILKYQITIYDNQNLNKALCNVLIEIEDSNMNIYSINYFNKSTEHTNIYQFQMICKNYIKRLIEDCSFIFETIFGVIPTKYITKFIRIDECGSDEKNFKVGSTNKKQNYSITDMDFYEYLNHNEQKQPSDDLIKTVEIDLNETNIKTVYKFNFIVKNKYVLTFDGEETNKYEIANLKDIGVFEYREQDGNYECFYRNKNIYAVHRISNENNNKILYHNDKIICYCDIIWTLNDVHLLNNNIVLLERNCKINNELKLLSNTINNESILRHCLKTEFGYKYSNATKFMVQPIYNIDN